MSNKKSLALIGAGNWGKNLARVFHSLGVLHSICDTQQAAIESVTGLYPDVNLTTNFMSLLARPEIDKVVIATPAAQHYQLAKEALLAGKDTFVEKPLCLNTSEAEELIQLAKSRNLILMVGHLLQYHPCVIKLKEILAEGGIGKLQYISSSRLNLGNVRTEENALWSFAPHDISVILSLLNNQFPLQLRSTGEAYLTKGVADTTVTTMVFPENIRAHLFVSWINPFKEQKLVLVGSSGIIVFDDMKPWEEKLQLFKQHIRWENGSTPRANKVTPERVHVEQSEPLKNECEHFLQCCENRKQPKTDGAEGLRVLQILQAANSSLHEGGKAKDPKSFRPPRHQQALYFAHSSAYIDPGAEIGEGVKIWHFSHIMTKAKIGPSCNIGQNVLVSSDVVLGRNVKVQNNVSIYTGVICEDDVFLGPSVVLTNVTNPRSAVNRKNEYKKTLIKRGATVGANATILCGVELGEYCFIGAGAVVTKNVKPYALIIGNPGRQTGWMSKHGEKLDLPVRLKPGEEKTATCPATGEEYLLRGDTLTLLNESLSKV